MYLRGTLPLGLKEKFYTKFANVAFVYLANGNISSQTNGVAKIHCTHSCTYCLYVCIEF